MQISDLDDTEYFNEEDLNESAEVVVRADYNQDDFDEALPRIKNRDLVVDSSSENIYGENEEEEEEAMDSDPGNEWQATSSTQANYYSNQQVMYAPSPLELYQQPSSSQQEREMSSA